MGFSLEYYSCIAAAHFVQAVALLFHTLTSWSLSSASSSSSSSPQNLSRGSAIKGNLNISTYADLRREETTTACAVCLGDVRPWDEVRELSNCRHVFHRGCLDRWLDHDDRGTCPLCRAPLLRPPPPEPPVGPSWEVERLLHLFGDDHLMLP